MLEQSADHASPPLSNVLSVDVEDYFQVSAFAPYINRNEWDGAECRVEQNVERILEMLADCSAHATFFTLGWIAERYPQVARRIVESGHELASHGYGHLRVSEQDRAAFSSDVHRAKRVLEDIAGVRVRGYRAPSFSIGSDKRWAFEILEDAGYEYSSSIYPIRHDHYGEPDAPRFVHRVGAHLIEVPIATIRLFRRNWPAGGGGYFRLMPYALSRSFIQRVNRHDRQPVIFYFHPWELDAGQPRIRGIDLKTRFRHYVNIPRMERRLRRMLGEFSWDRIDRIVLGRA